MLESSKMQPTPRMNRVAAILRRPSITIPLVLTAWRSERCFFRAPEVRSHISSLFLGPPLIRAVRSRKVGAPSRYGSEETREPRTAWLRLTVTG